MWDVNTSALHAPDSQRQSLAAAEDSTASNILAAEAKWSHLIDDPALLEELKDYFCYAQVVSQQQGAAGAYDIKGEAHCRTPCNTSLQRCRSGMLAACQVS